MLHWCNADIAQCVANKFASLQQNNLLITVARTSWYYLENCNLIQLDPKHDLFQKTRSSARAISFTLNPKPQPPPEALIMTLPSYQDTQTFSGVLYLNQTEGFSPLLTPPGVGSGTLQSSTRRSGCCNWPLIYFIVCFCPWLTIAWRSPSHLNGT